MAEHVTPVYELPPTMRSGLHVLSKLNEDVLRRLSETLNTEPPDAEPHELAKRVANRFDLRQPPMVCQLDRE